MRSRTRKNRKSKGKGRTRSNSAAKRNIKARRGRQTKSFKKTNKNNLI
jgi:hypothetical protein